MSGWAEARNRVAVRSAKMQTPSTLSRAESTAARSYYPFSGRSGPFNWRTEPSPLRPISRASPCWRAVSREVTSTIVHDEFLAAGAQGRPPLGQLVPVDDLLATLHPIFLADGSAERNPK